jgi:hypothetical protein
MQRLGWRAAFGRTLGMGTIAGAEQAFLPGLHPAVPGRTYGCELELEVELLFCCTPPFAGCVTVVVLVVVVALHGCQ